MMSVKLERVLGILIAWDEVVHLSEETDSKRHDRLELVRNSLDIMF
jgi:hypothetical protein